ncbi:MAG: hypothetical protein J3K34DRAFT_375599, partial [Monoraphidium minutum]
MRPPPPVVPPCCLFPFCHPLAGAPEPVPDPSFSLPSPQRISHRRKSPLACGPPRPVRAAPGFLADRGRGGRVRNPPQPLLSGSMPRLLLAARCARTPPASYKGGGQQQPVSRSP